MSWQVERWRGIPGLEHSFGGRVGAPPEGVRSLRQVHGTTVVDVAEPSPRDGEGDGLVTDRPGVSVGVWTADCVPILLVAPRAHVAAALHSGWRGSAAGIAAVALQLFEERWRISPHGIEAALGPAIGGCCYQVGEEVRAAFTARQGGRGRRGFEERGGGIHLDLRASIAAELRDLGLAAVETIGPCTSCRGDVLWSFRRDRSAGRQLSYVGWTRER